MVKEKISASGATTLLVVEDDPAMLIALRDILWSAGYRVLTARNGKEALENLDNEKPALILSDIMMPIMDGVELLKAVRKKPYGTTIPFIFLTARTGREDMFAGKTLGVDDYITKPITRHELLAAVKSRLQRTGEFAMMAQLMAAKDSLRVLANAIEYKRGHIERVNAYAQLLAEELSWDSNRRNSLEFGAILHDIGQIRLPEALVLKPKSLDDKEWELMRAHPQEGARMIKGIPYLQPAIPIVLHHHERWDGKGYPDGLKGEQIPEEARLLSVADTFDAITSDRPYRAGSLPEVAYKEILSESGHQFDPKIVDAFKRCWDHGDFHEILSMDFETDNI